MPGHGVGFDTGNGEPRDHHADDARNTDRKISAQPTGGGPWAARSQSVGYIGRFA